MGHTKATPEHQRPTLETLRSQELWNAYLQDCTVEVSGLWESDGEGGGAEFKVTITGHAADVDEVVACIRDDGNLHNIQVKRITPKAKT